MAYSFQPLGGGAPPAPSLAGRSMAPQGAGRSTGWRVDGTTSSASRMAGEVEHPSTRQPALRSTYVDADEAAMKRALARIDGDGASRRAGNAFSRTNRSRIQSRLDSFGSTFSATKPLEEQKAKQAAANPYTTMSQRAVRVPRVGMGARHAPPPPVAFVPHRPTRAEIAARTGSDGRPVLEEVQLPVYVPTQSAEERKEELALRNQFKGRTPEEIVAAQRTAPQLFPRGRGSAQPDSPGTERRSYQVLHDQIADEIAERQRFIDSMRALGKAGQHELRIKNEIADRMSDLARVERLQRAADEQAGASPPRPVGGPAVVSHGA